MLDENKTWFNDGRRGNKISNRIFIGKSDALLLMCKLISYVSCVFIAF